MSGKEDSLDVRGLSCPEPVIRTKKMLSADLAAPLIILTDSKVSLENIRRLATNSGFTFSFSEHDGDYLINVSKEV